MRFNTLPKFVMSISALLILTACGKSAEELQAQERALDNDSTILSSCAFDDVHKISISTLSGEQTSAICEKMGKTLKKIPSIKLLRQLSKAVTLLQHGGSDELISNTYHFMRIAELRGQLENDDAMIATFNVVFKIANGTEGRVTAKDLNVFLSNLGDGARTMTDEGLINSAAMLSVMRQDQGE